VAVDAALACGLGLVGAAQLVSRRTPFQGRFLERPPIEGLQPPFLPPGAGIRPPPFDQVDALTYVLMALCAASLIPRRRFPLLTLAGVTALGSLYLARGGQPFSVQLIILVAIYTAVTDSGLARIQAIALSLLSVTFLAGSIVVADLPRVSANWAMDAAWVLAAIFLADSVRSRRAYALEAERFREEEARSRIFEERVQIARELHDVVGHNIALISVQAGAGEHALYKSPEKARDTFRIIRTAGQETMNELRSMVDVLRESGRMESVTAPMQGLDALDQLIGAVNSSGQKVSLSVKGGRRPIPTVVDLTAYRILQEALTNAVRHAPGSSVEVTVEYSPDRLALEVMNGRGDGSSDGQTTGGGHGLVGMRERVQAIGGLIETGPRPDGGYRVSAILPTVGS
jgi:signal transduction histidine kinase